MHLKAFRNALKPVFILIYMAKQTSTQSKENSQDSDEPPSQKPTITDFLGRTYQTSQYDELTPSQIARTYRYCCNGNKRAVEDFFLRINAFNGQEVIVKAKRDEGKPYTARGTLTPILIYEKKRTQTPAGIVLCEQQQESDLYEIVWFDRFDIGGVRLVGRHS